MDKASVKIVTRLRREYHVKPKELDGRGEGSGVGLERIGLRKGRHKIPQVDSCALLADLLSHENGS